MAAAAAAAAAAVLLLLLLLLVHAAEQERGTLAETLLGAPRSAPLPLKPPVLLKPAWDPARSTDMGHNKYADVCIPFSPLAIHSSATVTGSTSTSARYGILENCRCAGPTTATRQQACCACQKVCTAHHTHGVKTAAQSAGWGTRQHCQVPLQAVS
jgi:hypothetical protein